LGHLLAGCSLPCLAAQSGAFTVLQTQTAAALLFASFIYALRHDLLLWRAVQLTGVLTKAKSTSICCLSHVLAGAAQKQTRVNRDEVICVTSVTMTTIPKNETLLQAVLH
jgi:hypothetical protein